MSRLVLFCVLLCLSLAQVSSAREVPAREMMTRIETGVADCQWTVNDGLIKLPGPACLESIKEVAVIILKLVDVSAENVVYGAQRIGALVLGVIEFITHIASSGYVDLIPLLVSKISALIKTCSLGQKLLPLAQQYAQQVLLK